MTKYDTQEHIVGWNLFLNKENLYDADIRSLNEVLIKYNGYDNHGTKFISFNSEEDLLAFILKFG